MWPNCGIFVIPPVNDICAMWRKYFETCLGPNNGYTHRSVRYHVCYFTDFWLIMSAWREFYKCLFIEWEISGEISVPVHDVYFGRMFSPRGCNNAYFCSNRFGLYLSEHKRFASYFVKEYVKSNESDGLKSVANLLCELALSMIVVSVRLEFVIRN